MLCQQKEKPVQAKNKSAGYKTIRQTAVKTLCPNPAAARKTLQWSETYPVFQSSQAGGSKRSVKETKGLQKKTAEAARKKQHKPSGDTNFSPQKCFSLLFPRRPFFPTHPLPYVLPRTAPIPCVLSSFYVQYRKYKPIIQAAGFSMKLEKSGQRAKMDISIKSI